MKRKIHLCPKCGFVLKVRNVIKVGRMKVRYMWPCCGESQKIVK